MWFREKYKIITENPYNKKELNGLGMIIYSEWDYSFRMVMQTENIVHLFLNYSLGWKCSNYAFLESIPLINTLDIIDIHSNGIRSVEKQYDLITLSLNVPNCYNVNFNVFRNLKNVFYYGNRYNESLFLCKSIENLYIDNLKIGSKQYIANLTNLRVLSIANSDLEDLSFLKYTKFLNSLTIINCKKILSFNSISELNGLVKLDIRGIKNLHDINFISNLQDLEIIIIETDYLDSIHPLINLTNIKAFALLGKNFVIEDKDLSPIEHLKKLSMLNIPNKKCYSARINNYWNWNDFGKARDNWLSNKD